MEAITAIPIVYIIIYIIAVIGTLAAFSFAADEKGYKHTGMIIFLAVFGTPILAALYVVALPDKNLRQQ